jgi:hypothetical protein
VGFGTFANGWQNLGIRLKIDPDAEVGTPLVMENRIMGDELEVDMTITSWCMPHRP